MKEENAAVLLLDDGKLFKGTTFGATGQAIGEVCFNTGMTGYQEILTDPSYDNQIITFTFPHIGNIGTNNNDKESNKPAAKGLVIREEITEPSNFRSTQSLNNWLKRNKLVGICGIDTRHITHTLREKGSLNAVISYKKNGRFDIKDLIKKAAAWNEIKNCDLTKNVTRKKNIYWNETTWLANKGYGKNIKKKYHIVAIDYGAKDNILRNLASLGFKDRKSVV